MFNIDDWISEFVKILRQNFGDRIFFIGLQGSYARGEATANSDIDIVVVLDDFSVNDVKKYNSILDEMPNRNLICGFIAGKNELINWEKSEIFQFYHDTKPLFGSLEILKPYLTNEVIDRAIKIGVCTIYHGCVHNMLHEKSGDILKSLYKNAAFVIQAIHFKKTGEYINSHGRLINFVDSAEKEILQNFLLLRKDDNLDFLKASAVIFEWSKNLINNIKN